MRSPCKIRLREIRGIWRLEKGTSEALGQKGAGREVGEHANNDARVPDCSSLYSKRAWVWGPMHDEINESATERTGHYAEKGTVTCLVPRDRQGYCVLRDSQAAGTLSIMLRSPFRS